MKREEQKNLLEKYYKGETSLQEEEELKKSILSEKNSSSDKDMFNYFQFEGEIPNDLEEHIFSNLPKNQNHKRSVRMRLLSLASAAAVIAILLTIYLDFRKVKNKKIEDDFFVMEQALYQISQSIQPEVQEEMLVLWVDDNVEIIIN